MEVMNRGHYEIAMRVLLFILGVFAVIVSIEKPAEARRGAWCANYNMGGGATNCGFATFQQCMAAVSAKAPVVTREVEDGLGAAQTVNHR